MRETREPEGRSDTPSGPMLIDGETSVPRVVLPCIRMRFPPISSSRSVEVGMVCRVLRLVFTPLASDPIFAVWTGFGPCQDVIWSADGRPSTRKRGNAVPVQQNGLPPAPPGQKIYGVLGVKPHSCRWIRSAGGRFAVTKIPNPLSGKY